MPTAPATAAPCHKESNKAGDRSVCLVEIKRSAKYPWEYRVTLSRDGAKQPPEIYNCRDRIRVSQDGSTRSFQTGETGDWICRLTQRS